MQMLDGKHGETKKLKEDHYLVGQVISTAVPGSVRKELI